MNGLYPMKRRFNLLTDELTENFFNTLLPLSGPRL